MNFIQYIKQVWKAGTSGGTPLSPDRLMLMVVFQIKDSYLSQMKLDPKWLVLWMEEQR